MSKSFVVLFSTIVASLALFLGAGLYNDVKVDSESSVSKADEIRITSDFIESLRLFRDDNGKFPSNDQLNTFIDKHWINHNEYDKDKAKSLIKYDLRLVENKTQVSIWYGNILVDHNLSE